MAPKSTRAPPTTFKVLFMASGLPPGGSSEDHGVEHIAALDLVTDQRSSAPPALRVLGFRSREGPPRLSAE